MNDDKIQHVGILGGTLDPIHLGHMIMAQEALDKFKLDYVLVMPSGNPPHKSDEHITSKIHRSNMVKLAINDNQKLVFSDFELNREGYIYTSDTLKMLTDSNPNVKYYFILGADSLFTIEKWHDPSNVMKYATLVVADRDINYISEFKKTLKEQIQYLREKYGANIVFLKMPNIDISSTFIRDKVKENSTIKYYVPTNVEQYILENNLYKL